MSARGTGHRSPGVPAGRGGSRLDPTSRAWEMRGASAGDSRTVRGFNEPPNPLIRFLAREMGLFSPSRLRWGEEIVKNRDFAEKMGDAEVGGKGKPWDGGHGLLVRAPCASQDGERCPVCPAQGGESHGQVPLPRQVQAPQGTAALGKGGTEGAKLRMELWSEGKGQGPPWLAGV